jgi:carboxypeptidase family protein
MVSSSARTRISTLVVLVALLNAAIAFGQVVTGAILGRVKDATGAVVPGVTVQIQNVETGFSRTEQTDSGGPCLSRSLPLSSYTVVVQQAGFQTQVRRGIVLTVASEVTVNVELAVGNVQEKVEVTAAAPAVETTNATLSGLVGQDEMRDLPLNGRLAKTALGGWAVNGIYSYGSGLPIDIPAGFNNSQDGDAAQPDRPNLAPGFSNNPVHGVMAGRQGIPAGQSLRTPDRWFDPGAFDLPAAGFYGNLGRNRVTAPGLFTADFTLVKTTPLTEQKKLEFRAEFFNLLNHANFGLPVLNVFNSSRIRAGNSGAITNTSTANRQIQLGMKLTF